MAKRAKKATEPALPLKPIPPIDQWPAANIERWPVARIKPNPLNPRTHPEKQLALLDTLFREYGQTRPVLVGADDEMLIAGHGFHLAATRAGAGELVVALAKDWPPEKKTAYTIADNQAGLLSGWDEPRLGLQLADLSKLATVDVTKLGFSKPALARLMPGEVRDGQTDPDAPGAAVGGNGEKIAISRPGDLWQLGAHRLVCGDATNPDHVALARGEYRPQLMVTDQPYGVNYDPAWRNARPTGQSRLVRRGFKGRSIEREVQNDDIADWSLAWSLFDGDVAYVWHAALQVDVTIAALEAAGLKRRSHITWAKPHFVVGRGDYHWQTEVCWYCVREGGKAHWSGDRAQSTLWQITGNMGFLTKTEGADARVDHGTQKPVECMQRPITNNSRKGDAVYEPFCGSGTTIIAAERTGRVCCAIEIDPACVDIAILRWEAFTGLRAIHAATGVTYSHVSAQRRAEAKATAR